MIPELGLFSLILATVTATLLAVLPMVGSFSGQRRFMELAKPSALMLFFFVGLSFACLIFSFIVGDYSVKYVAQTSNSSLPLVYKISGVWGGHEGSILFWVFILAVWTAAVAVFGRSIPLLLLSRVLSVLGFLAIGFLLFVILTSNPFERLIPAQADGFSLNPLLQDPGMAAHPPMLYMGYVGFAVAFAFAISALIGGQLDSATLRFMRPWTNIAWVFLTLGISIGSYWAYYELGWGGWWFWDPVENASFMPWLVGTALIHSLAASEKRGVLKAWTVLLAVLAFSLSLLGTFLVRSGVLTSVHAFATDPTRGAFVLGFLVVVVGGSLALFAFRAAKLKSDVSFELVSRESALLINNILLVVACAVVLLGTLFPLFVDALGKGKISVGSQYFNTMFVPLMTPIVLLVGLGALLNWRRDNLKGRRRALQILAIASVFGALIIATVWIPYEGKGLVSRVIAAVTLAMAIWVTATTVFGLFYRLRNKHNRLSAVLHTPAAFWGMSIAHVGLAVFTVGVALTSLYAEEQTVKMTAGETHSVAGYTFRFDGISEVRGPNYNAARGEFTIEKNGSSDALFAEKRVYDVRRDLMTEAGIDGSLTRDIFIALGEPLSEGAWSVRLQVKPFIRWIWLGTLFMAFGGLLAASDRRYKTKKAKAPAVQQDPSSSASSAGVAKPAAGL